MDSALDGRDAIQLGSGCDMIVPGVNVLYGDLDGELRLQVVDRIRGPLNDAECTVVLRQHVSDVPCATNPAGQCDAAFS